MRNVIIVGSGAVAAEITSYIEDNNIRSEGNQRLNILGYLDSEENIDRYWSKYKLKKKVIADIHSYQPEENDHFIIGISDIDFRSKMIDILNQKGGKMINFIHNSAIIADSATLGQGNIIYPFCIIGPNTIIGDHNLITSYSFISHDCIVGDNNFFSTAGISGRVNIKNSNFFGIRSTVLPYVSIGNKNTIQAGMIVDKSVSDNALVFHRFKEKVIAINNSRNDE
jgi:sugar O-acyltransferase (sialic acid O-acetyltransferase NeuD family)